MEGLVLKTDGGSRGNPGPAAAAFVLLGPGGETVSQGAEYLGEATNNVAEYQGLMLGLVAALEHEAVGLEVLMDSELVVKQLSGEYRVKDQKLAALFEECQALLDQLPGATVSHIGRAENAEADALVNQALDQALGRTAPTVQQVAGEYSLTVRDHFDAAHELRGYPGECRELHGHTWDVEVTVTGTLLDELGIVYDFKTLKEDLGSVLSRFDHGHLNAVPPFDVLNPTAENLARVICDALVDKVGDPVTVYEVAVWESPIAKIVYRPRT